MFKLIPWLLAALCFIGAAYAQQTTTPGIVAIACAYNGSPFTITSGQFALAQCDQNGNLIANASAGPSGVTAVTGTCTTTGQSSNFTPIAGRGFNINISGTFTGTVELQRFLNGVWNNITAAGTQLFVWTGGASEQYIEPQFAVPYRINCTAVGSGTIAYSMSQ